MILFTIIILLLICQKGEANLLGSKNGLKPDIVSKLGQLLQIQLKDQLDETAKHTSTESKFNNAMDLIEATKIKENITDFKFLLGLIIALAPQSVSVINITVKELKSIINNDIYHDPNLNTKYDRGKSIVMLENPSTLENLINQQNNSMLDSNSLWFIHGHISDLDPKVYIPMTSNFFMYENHKTFIEIKEIYQISANVPVKSKLWGIWSPVIGLIQNEAFLFERRKDLSGLTLKCASNTDGSNMIIKPIEGTKYFKISGLFADVWHTLQNQLNFSYSVISHPQKKFGTKYSNGTWSGLVGMLQRNEVEMIMPLSITPGRTQEFGASLPIHEQG